MNLIIHVKEINKKSWNLKTVYFKYLFIYLFILFFKKIFGSDQLVKKNVQSI